MEVRLVLFRGEGGPRFSELDPVLPHPIRHTRGNVGVRVVDGTRPVSDRLGFHRWDIITTTPTVTLREKITYSLTFGYNQFIEQISLPLY